MPRLIWSEAARNDLVRLHAFLERESPQSASRALGAIWNGVDILRTHPGIGPQLPGAPETVHRLTIPFGRGAYIVAYHYAAAAVILRVRHSREAGYWQ